MNRSWNWLKTAIENRPITFVIIGGILSYALGMIILAASFILGTTQDLGLMWLRMAIGSSVPIAFHWFVARYERKSHFAQILALIPVVFLFGFVSMGAGILGVKTQSCIEDPITKEIRDCRDGWRMIWDVD